jgi:hypothetical protein
MASLGFLVIRRAGSTPGASTKPNDLAERVGRRTRVAFPGPNATLIAARQRIPLSQAIVPF